MAVRRPIALSERDQAILRDLLRVRLLTGNQMERLHFSAVATANARGSDRRRVLRRLVELHLVTTLPRQVGGARAGSAGLIYALDSRALRLAEFWMPSPSAVTGRVRRPWTIGWPFVQHTLDVAELYTRLRERDRARALRLLRFDAEPASWYRTPLGLLKPDAYAVYESGDWEQHRWIEVDRATESLPTLRRKLLVYVELAASNAEGPAGVLPRVLLTVPAEARADAVRAVVASLPTPAPQLIVVELFSDSFGTSARPPPG